MLNAAQKTNRRFMKMERIARLELQGYSDVEIAIAVGITKQYVSMLRRTKEFIQVRTQIASGVLLTLDTDVDEAIQMSQEQLKAAVPNAVQILKNTMLDSTLNPRLRFDAAKEICDREGTFVKISKSEVKETKKFSFDIGDTVTDDLLAALQQSAAKKTIEGSDDFVDTAELAENQQSKNLELISNASTLEDTEPVSKTIQ